MDQAQERRGRRTRRRLSALLTALAGVALLAAMITIALWYRDGGRYQVVATPSMGTFAPVGTLVLTEPAAAYRLGDVITYQPPVPQPQDTKTHRIVRIEPGPDGPLYIARGDINGAEDPWKIPQRSVVGKVVFAAHGVGWLLRATPLLALGGAVVWWGTKLLATRFWRVPLRVLGFSLLLVTTTLVLKPFVATITRSVTADAAGTHITVISTGMLPIRVTAMTGGFVDLASGEIQTLTTIPPPGARGAPLTSGVHMPWWLWLTMMGLWMLPMVYGLVAAVRRPLPDAPPDGGEGPEGRGPGPGVMAAAPAVVLVSALLLSLVARPTQAGYTATVANSTNTAASAAYFTCGGAFPGVAGAPNTYFVWPLDDAAVVTLSTARDASGNARTGTYVNGFTSTTTPCSRDTPNRAVTLAPTATLPSYVATTALTAVASRNVFSEAVWFRTSTTTGGRLIGWGNLRTGPSTTYDRHVYMTDGGQIVFGVYPNNTVRTVVSPAAYNDGRWHLAVAVLSPAGAALYLDGAQVAGDATITSAEGGTTNTGFWRVGWDSTGGWTSSPTTSYWTGSLGYAAVYTVALSAAQVRQLYVAGV